MHGKVRESTLRIAALFSLLLFPINMMAANNILENETVLLEVSPQTGSILKILDKRTQTNYIGDRSRAKLFRLLLPKPGHLARRINSWDQEVESIEVENETLIIRFHSLQVARQKYLFQVGTVEVPEPRLAINVTVMFRLRHDHVFANIQVENHSLEEITDVTFPWIGGLVRQSKGQEARVVLPSLSQKVYRNTADFLLGERYARYPALLATTWLNYEFPSKGVGIEARSPPETQDALFSLSPNLLTQIGPSTPSYWGPHDFPYIAWNFYPHIGGQNRWTSPDVLIHVHQSDWRTIASEHREWYRKLFAPTRITAFDHTIGFATYRLKKADNTVNWTYAEITKLANEARLAGIDTLVIEGWREREGPGNPSPFGEIADPRLGGGERLKHLVEQLGQQGVKLIFSVHPTLLNTATERYKEGAHRWTVKTRRQGNQLPVAFTFFSFDYPYQEHAMHYWATIDPSSQATDYLLREARRLQDEYGFQHLFLRGVGLQSFLSYNHESVIPPQRTYLAGYDRFLGGLRELFGQGLLLMEGLNDLVNQYGDGGYTWSQTDDAEILAVGIPWTQFSNDVEALAYDQANASFARKILVNLIVDGGDGTVGRYPEFARHLKALRDLKEAAIPYYVQAEFRHHEGLEKLEGNTKTVVSVFQNRASGQKGVVLANLSEEKKNITLGVDLTSLKTTGSLLRMSGSTEPVELAPEAAIEIGPHEVAILGIDPKQSRGSGGK